MVSTARALRSPLMELRRTVGRGCRGEYGPDLRPFSGDADLISAYPPVNAGPLAKAQQSEAVALGCPRHRDIDIEAGPVIDDDEF